MQRKGINNRFRIVAGFLSSFFRNTFSLNFERNAKQKSYIIHQTLRKFDNAEEHSCNIACYLSWRQIWLPYIDERKTNWSASHRLLKSNSKSKQKIIGKWAWRHPYTTVMRAGVHHCDLCSNNFLKRFRFQACLIYVGFNRNWSVTSLAFKQFNYSDFLLIVIRYLSSLRSIESQLASWIRYSLEIHWDC